MSNLSSDHSIKKTRRQHSCFTWPLQVICNRKKHRSGYIKPRPAVPEPVVDEDGFTSVVKGHRRPRWPQRPKRKTRQDLQWALVMSDVSYVYLSFLLVTLWTLRMVCWRIFLSYSGISCCGCVSPMESFLNDGNKRCNPENIWCKKPHVFLLNVEKLGKFASWSRVRNQTRSRGETETRSVRVSCLFASSSAPKVMIVMFSFVSDLGNRHCHWL